jgi:hypothetical protein
MWIRPKRSWIRAMLPSRSEPELAQPDFQTRPVEPPYRSIDYGWPFTGSPREASPIERMLAAVDRTPRSFEGLR